jgi:Protein of unknown function (DUF3617)
MFTGKTNKKASICTTAYNNSLFNSTRFFTYHPLHINRILIKHTIRVVFVSLIITLFTSVSSSAQTPDVKPGLWESVTTTKGTGVVMPDLSQLPPDKREAYQKALTDLQTKQKTITTKHCLTEEDIKNFAFDYNKNSSDCKSKATQISSDTWNVTEHCETEGGTEDTEMQIHVLSNTHVKMHGTMTIMMGGNTHKSDIDVDSHWVSSDCGDVK